MTKKIVALMTIVAILMMSAVVATAAPSFESEVAPPINDAVSGDGTEIPTGELVVTPVTEADELPPEKEEDLQQAFDDIRSAASVEEFINQIGETADVNDILEGTDVDIADLAVHSLFDVSAYGTAADILAANGSVTITFQISYIKKGDPAVVLHKGSTGWETLPSWTGNGTVSATFTSLSPVMILVEEPAQSGPVDGPQTSDLGISGILFGCATITMLGVLAFNKRKA